MMPVGTIKSKSFNLPNAESRPNDCEKRGQFESGYYLGVDHIDKTDAISQKVVYVHTESLGHVAQAGEYHHSVQKTCDTIHQTAHDGQIFNVMRTPKPGPRLKNTCTEAASQTLSSNILSNSGVM
ncbi:hypothetical protein BpHYR1_054202 [Brachionus plicatilis]|uniref:Uncharacterized protein n=1 Tax=Brachionus plicatilis TaxID=10195 RepID=A0A3M7RJ30_BRAPC|nr:hypothetical protein BpHYR1_054202 [Brachionus plicatilis]